MQKFKRLIFFIPVILGVALIVTLVKNKQPPVRPEFKEHSRTVSALTVQPMWIVPRVLGYGYSVATETWEAIPEVSGKVVEMDSELKKGVFYSKGDLLLRIDPESYGLAKSRGVASVMSIEAELKELEQQQENTKRLIVIEEESLRLAANELARKKRLHQQGYLSQSELDTEEKNYLAQETSLKNLQNSLALIPSQKKALLARKDSDISSLSELKLDLEKTVIRAPFDCRISEVNVELNEFAQTGSVLLKAVNLDEAEIAVQLTPNEFVKLLSTPVNMEELFAEGVKMDKIREVIGVTAQVRLPMFHREAVWDGLFRRTSESVNQETGALTVYVSVTQPYQKMIPGVRPPLVPNLYCEVELQGRKRPDRYIVPTRAVHKGKVHLVDADSRLKSKEVSVEMVMGDYAVISNGLAPGDKIVLTDLVPAIMGMLLDPMEDTKTAAAIADFSAGK